jgi:hypothetical protein
MDDWKRKHNNQDPFLADDISRLDITPFSTPSQHYIPWHDIDLVNGLSMTQSC